jgi:2-iminobutanoate/2-iminopropanoate deaminase
MRNLIHTENAPQPLLNLYSQGILAQGKLIFTAGQVGMAPDTGTLVDGGVQEQTQQALRNVKAIVEAAGSDISQVVKVTVLLDNIDDFGAMNEIYKTYFADSPPARTAYEVARLPIGALVEIEAIAVVE